MNKLFTKIAAAFVGMAMAIGVGVAVASNKNAILLNAASGDVLAEFTGAVCGGTTYARYSDNDSHSVTWVGCGSSNGTLGSSKASQHNNIKVVSDDIAALKAVKSDVAANDTGLYFYYTKTALSNVNRITLSGTISGNANATIYAITGNAVSSSTGAAYTQISLKSDSPTKQGDTFSSGVDFTFDTVSSAKYYGIVIVTSSFKKIANGSVKIYEGGSAGSPEVSITSNQFLLPKNNGTTITAQANEYAPAGSTINYAVDNANVSLSATTGSSTKLTVSDSVTTATKVTVTVTLKNSGGTTLDTKTKSLLVSSKSANSTSEAIIASEAKSLVSTAEIDGKELYVKGFANNSAAKYVWLSDAEDTTKTFEVYNSGGLSSYSDGTFIVAHGNAKKYSSTTMEIESATVDSANYFALSTSEVEVDDTQYVDITASNVSSGTISWSKTAGTGDVTLSNQSNEGVRITGNGVGTAVVTATLGNLVRTISVTVKSYATDWSYKDITLTAEPGFNTLYSVGEPLDIDNLTVTLIENSATLDKDRETIIDNDDVTFNFDSSSPAVINLTATYDGHTTDDVIQVTIENIATILLNDANTSSFWPESTSYCGRHGVVGTGTAYGAFDGVWYPNSGFQMNKKAAGAYIANAISVGTIKTIVLNVTTGPTNSSQFSMYYGTTANPDTNKITPSVSDGTWTYDFSEVTATYFNLAKDVSDGNTVIGSISITYNPNGAFDRSEAGAYSDYFLAKTEGLCDPDGINNGVSGVWETLNGVYNLLSETTKSTLKAKAIAEVGIPDGTTVGNAMARYYWAIKNHDANTDFIGDGDISSAARANLGFVVNDKESSATTIIIIVSMISITAIGGYFFIRKRKEQ